MSHMLTHCDCDELTNAYYGNTMELSNVPVTQSVNLQTGNWFVYKSNGYSHTRIFTEATSNERVMT